MSAKSSPMAAALLLSILTPAFAHAQYYAHRFAQGDLVMIDLDTGVETTIGNTGITSAFGFSFNPVPVAGMAGTIDRKPKRANSTLQVVGRD